MQKDGWQGYNFIAEGGEAGHLFTQLNYSLSEYETVKASRPYFLSSEISQCYGNSFFEGTGSWLSKQGNGVRFRLNPQFTVLLRVVSFLQLIFITPIRRIER